MKRIAVSRAQLEIWALVAEVIAAVAVVISVIYLGLQIADSNRLLRSQAHYNALSLAQRPLEMIVDNETLAGVVAQCDVRPAQATPTNWARCLNYYFMQFNAWEYMYYQRKDGSIPDELWRGADASFKHRVATKPGYRRFWSEYRIAFDEPFKGYAEQQFRRPEPKG
jgi:hypothetical protein